MSRIKYHTKESNHNLNRMESLNRSEFNRWAAFLIGLDKIEEHCKYSGVDFYTMELKPPAIKRYILESAPEMDDFFQKDIIKKNKDILCGILQGILKASNPA